MITANKPNISMVKVLVCNSLCERGARARPGSRLGGLWRVMPWTAGLVALGAVAISALATACDAGLIELFEGDWLDGLADKLETMLKEEKK
jgi:NADH:ubiquinone oxidoreductase subunit 4 (subunit M)